MFWCGHCKRLQPVWEQLGHAVAGQDIRIAKIDCTRYTNVATELDIHGFPTILFFRSGQVSDFMSWCGNCKRLQPVWEQLGHALAGQDIRIAKIDCTRYTNVATELDIHGFPTILFFRSGQVSDFMSWCGNCKRLQPVWEQLGHALAGQDIRIAKIDCTRYTNVATELDIHGFPTILFFRSGQVSDFMSWCGNCKRLQPVWEQLGHALAGQDIRIAKIDCTRYTNVATELDIHGFPTILFFRSGQIYRYEGDRTKDAFLDYALKTIGPEVRVFNGPREDFHRKVFFPHAQTGFFLFVTSTGEDASLSREMSLQYHEAAMQQFTNAFFFETSLAHISHNISIPHSPSIWVFKDDGAQFEYNPATGEDFSAFVDRERFPLYPEITYGNMHEMGTCCAGRRLLVMTVSDLVQRTYRKGQVEDTPTRRFDLMLQETALKYRAELSRDFQFGWLDGNELANGIVLTQVRIPSLLVFNYSSYQYYIPDDPPDKMTPESIALYLQTIRDGGVPGLGGKGFVQRFKRMLFDLYTTVTAMFINQPLLSVCLFGLPLGLFSVICYALCSADISDDDTFMEESEDDDPDTDHEKLD